MHDLRNLVEAKNITIDDEINVPNHRLPHVAAIINGIIDARPDEARVTIRQDENPYVPQLSVKMSNFDDLQLRCYYGLTVLDFTYVSYISGTISSAMSLENQREAARRITLTHDWLATLDGHEGYRYFVKEQHLDDNGHPLPGHEPLRTIEGYAPHINTRAAAGQEKQDEIND